MIRMSSSNSAVITPKLLVIVLALNYVQQTEQLKFNAVQIPSLVQRNTNFWLSCQYQLDHQKQDQLYSVKWYKNNEEFYRLIFPSPIDSSNSNTNTNSYTNQAQENLEISNNQQQHYFSQTGVNVMMSSSNATHVRLLNASIESEGVYACEISTQNLSTIRYEKEIRVYVLPQTRLNIIGFRNRYSFGDKVDLICSSDFSRPKPALAWFINGQRIPSYKSSWFEQELENGVKLNEPSLFRLNLRLKFKLSPEFLAAFTTTLRSSSSLKKLSTPQRSNQSQTQTQTTSTRQQQTIGEGNQKQLSSSQKVLEKLEIQCRYKLTEVSDVTYNELTLAHHSLVSSTSSNRNSGPPLPVEVSAPKDELDSLDEEEDDLELNRKSSAAEWRSRRWTNRSSVLVQKSSDGNQVLQGRSPAKGDQIWRSIVSEVRDRQQSSCQLGSLVLLPEDPVILEPAPGNRHNRAEHQEGGKDRHEVEMIRVNCSTISALVGTTVESSEDDDATTSSFGGGNNNNNNNNNLLSSSSSPSTSYNGYCGDQTMRRHSLVSGKTHLTPNEPSHQRFRLAGGSSASSGGQRQVNQRQLIAYLSLIPPAGTNSSSSQTMEEENLNTNNNNNELQRHLHQFTTPIMGQSPTTGHQNLNADSSDSSLFTSSAVEVSPSSKPLAPPLLEWFINNQEAPRVSASYSPELPILRQTFEVASGADSKFQQTTTTTPGGREESAAEVVPPIDYADYFANFDSRPMKQHLMLNLRPDKRHFLTPDSKLTLRCSSTQAQVLASDAISLLIVPSTSSSPIGGQVGGWQPSKTRYGNKQRLSSSNQARASRVLSPSQNNQASSRGSNGGQSWRHNSPPISIILLAIILKTLLL